MTLPITPQKPLGEYINVYLARSTDPEIRKRRISSGGAVTSIICYLLEHKLCDAAVVAKRTVGLQGEVVVARTRNEVLEAAGDKWSIVPFTSRLRRIIEDEGLRNVVIVGLPCQVQFLGHMKAFPILETDFGERIKVLISLFCIGTFAHEVFLAYLRSAHGIRAEEIKGMRISGDDLIVTLISGKEIPIPIREAYPYLQAGCLLCTDYTGVLADISAGTVQSKRGYTILITRTKLGEEIVTKAANEGYIEITEGGTEVVNEVVKNALEKLARAQKYAVQLL